MTNSTHLANRDGEGRPTTVAGDAPLGEPAASGAGSESAVPATFFRSSRDVADDAHLAGPGQDDADGLKTVPAGPTLQPSPDHEPPETATEQDLGSNRFTVDTTPDEGAEGAAVIEGDHDASTDDGDAHHADETVVDGPIGDAAEGPATNGRVASKRSSRRRRQRIPDRAAGEAEDDRVDRPPDAVAEVIANADDKSASLGPLVRHMNALTLHLAEAHQAIGRLTAERDALRRQLLELQGAPIPDDPPRPNKEARVEVRQERQEARAEAKAAKAEARADDPSAMTPEELAEWRESVARRRRLIAGGVLAVLVAAFVIANQMDWNLSGRLSRGSLGTIAYIGPIIQIFLAAWIIYRIARVSGRAARWLSPSDQELRRKRR